MNFKALVAASLTAFASASSMAAVCTSGSSLGTLGSSDLATFGNSFQRAQQFNDCYSFSLVAPSDTLGLTLEWDLSSRLDIDIDSVSLSGGSLSAAMTNSTPSFFSFNDLLSGTYQLAVKGVVSDDGRGWNGAVGYFGVLATTAPRVASPVPEPETIVMLGLGLAIVARTARRKKA